MIFNQSALKSVAAICSSAFMFMMAGTSHADSFAIPLILNFEGDAAAQLRAVGEKAEVVAHFYGEPVDINDPELDDAAQFLSREVLSVYPRNQLITLGGSLSGAPLEKTRNQLISVRAFRGDYTDSFGELDCTQAEMSVKEAMTKGITLTCRVVKPFDEWRS